MGYQTASVLLAPVIVLQGRRVRRTTPRLPEPAGPRSGVSGEGPPLRLLLLGDSAAAGVGVSSQAEALSGRLVAELAPAFHLTWRLVARTGATTAGTLRHLERHAIAPGASHEGTSAETASGDRDLALDEGFDVAVVSVGLNDVTGRRPLGKWMEDVDALVALLRARFGVRHVLLSGVPPLHAMTALPQPMRWYLGATARRFDRALAGWAARNPNVELVSLASTDVTGKLAADGLHPGPALYRAWSADVGQRIRARWAGPARALPPTA